MRIGVATTSYPRFDGDVAGVFVRDLCRALARRGHSLEVLAPADDVSHPVDDPGISLLRIAYRPRRWPRTFYGAGAPDNLADPRAFLGALTFPTRLAAAIARRAHQWDAVLSHWAVPSAIAVRVGLGTAHPRPLHVAVWHSADVTLAARTLGRDPWRWARTFADRHVFVAAHLADRLGAEVSEATVIPMGVSLPSGPPHRDRSSHRPLRALVLARLVPIKRVEIAIDACASAGSVELTVAGDGPERRRLEARARARGLVARFVGWVDGPAKDRWLEWADVLLATSGSAKGGGTEGCPVAPREALARGVVVVAVDEIPYRELAARCGAPMLVRHERDLAPTLRTLANDRALLASLSKLAPRSVVSDSWDVIAERFERCLTSNAATSQSSTRTAPRRSSGENADASMPVG